MAKRNRISQKDPHQGRVSEPQLPSDCVTPDDVLDSIMLSVATNEQMRLDLAIDETSRIEAKLAEFLPGIDEVALSIHQDAFVRELVLQAFLPPGKDADGLYPNDALTSLSVPERLIDEVVSGAEPGRNIDRRLLREDLRLCILSYQLQSSLDSSDTSKRSVDELHKIKNLAIDLRGRLGGDLSKLGIDWFVYEPNAVPRFEFDDLLKDLDRLIEKSKWQLAFTPDKPLLRGALSPIERLVGVNLPLVFRSHYGKEPGGGDRGPFIRFAVSVLSAAQMPLARATIKKYLNNANNGVGRRTSPVAGGRETS